MKIENNIEVSIILINYNTPNLLFDAIDSILLYVEKINYEIIVVDNNSRERLYDQLQAKYKARVQYIYLSSNVGFGRANNEGIKKALGKKLFFLNTDTKLLNNAVKILSDFLDKYENVGICGGNLYDEDLEPTHSFMPFFPSILSEVDLLFANIPFKIIYGKKYWFNDTGIPKKVAHITGADLMISRCLIDKIGGFDNDFFLYYEEAELCFRARKKGYDAISVPTAKIQHLESKSMLSSAIKQSFLTTSRYLYLRKTHSTVYVFICNLIFYITCLTRIISFRIFNRKEQLDYWKRQLNFLRKSI